MTAENPMVSITNFVRDVDNKGVDDFLTYVLVDQRSDKPTTSERYCQMTVNAIDSTDSDMQNEIDYTVLTKCVADIFRFASILNFTPYVMLPTFNGCKLVSLGYVFANAETVRTGTAALDNIPGYAFNYSRGDKMVRITFTIPGVYRD